MSQQLRATNTLHEETNNQANKQTKKQNKKINSTTIRARYYICQSHVNTHVNSSGEMPAPRGENENCQFEKINVRTRFRTVKCHLERVL